MATSKSIKSKIRATKRTHQVTKAMEAVSAVKMRKSQHSALQGRWYARMALSLLARMSKTTMFQTHPFIKEGKGNKVLYCVVTSDRGLAGGFNATVLRSIERDIKDRALDKSTVGIIAVGRRGYEHFKNRGYTTEATFPYGDGSVTKEGVESIVGALTQRFLLGAYSTVLIAYSNFRSTFLQEAVIHTVLPLRIDTLSAVVVGIVADKDMLSSSGILNPAPPEYSMDASSEEITPLLIEKLLQAFVYHVLLESRAGEHSARMVAMKNASEKSKEMATHLNRVYNKIRQAGITREVSEIIGGSEAVHNG